MSQTITVEGMPDEHGGRTVEDALHVVGGVIAATERP